MKGGLARLVAAGLLVLMSGCGRETAEPGGASGGPAAGGPVDRVAALRYARARSDMILEILDDGAVAIVDGAVLEAMMAVPRHLFLDPLDRERGYENRPLRIGSGQVTSKPSLAAFMTQLLELRGDERVLEIGTGTGYHAAILSRMARRVTTLEIEPALAERARDLLSTHARCPVTVICKDGLHGHAEGGPYDAILVACGLESLPSQLTDQLAPGGRLVAPVGPPGKQRLMRVLRGEDGLRSYEALRVRFHPIRRAPSPR